MIETSFSSYEFSLLFVRLALLFDKNEISLRKNDSTSRTYSNASSITCSYPTWSNKSINMSIRFIFLSFLLPHFSKNLPLNMLNSYGQVMRYTKTKSIFNVMKERKMSYFSSIISYYKCLFSLFMRLILWGIFSKNPSLFLWCQWHPVLPALYSFMCVITFL